MQILRQMINIQNRSITLNQISSISLGSFDENEYSYDEEEFFASLVNNQIIKKRLDSDV